VELPLEEMLCPGGKLEESLPGYEFRPSQLTMAQAVEAAILDHNHLCVEAGTGTGKTLAYLIPSVFTRGRVIISTATINLQEQLLRHDLPLIRQVLLPNLKTTYMKGRRNYLCIKKFYELKGRHCAKKHHVTLDEWQKSTSTGDRSELEWLEDEDPLWYQVDARRETCVGKHCEHFSECWITKMRQKAYEADIVVVNHALLFANLALEKDEIGKVLPDFSVLVLDEAHEVEEIAADYFGTRVSNYQLEDLLRQFKFTYPNGFEFGDTLRRLEMASSSFFSGFPGKEGRYSLNFFRPVGGSPVDLREKLFPEYQELDSCLKLLSHQLELSKERPAEAASLSRRVDHLLVALEDLFQIDSPDRVYWFERSGRGVFLRLTPIRIAPILREKVFSRADSVILTSATLTTGGDFEYIKGRLGIPDPVEVVVPGEFDYGRQAVLHVPKAISEPRSESYFHLALDEIRMILKLTDGHAFLLFTSLRQMDRIYQELRRDGLYPMLRQGEMPKSRLLEIFKSEQRSVLCATSSFWQGVDVRGDALRAVVIDKLPFQVPSEPLVAARSEELRKEGRDPFYEYMIPAAIIALKQGLGRLIRSRQDTGILAVLDSRLWRRPYGELFFNSLPNCAVTDNIENLENFWGQNVSRPVGEYLSDG
jgi:ATP-dependent DNA helicase DinG